MIIVIFYINVLRSFLHLDRTIREIHSFIICKLFLTATRHERDLWRCECAKLFPLRSSTGTSRGTNCRQPRGRMRDALMIWLANCPASASCVSSSQQSIQQQLCHVTMVFKLVLQGSPGNHYVCRVPAKCVNLLDRSRCCWPVTATYEQKMTGRSSVASWNKPRCHRIRGL